MQLEAGVGHLKDRLGAPVVELPVVVDDVVVEEEEQDDSGLVTDALAAEEEKLLVGAVRRRSSVDDLDRAAGSVSSFVSRDVTVSSAATV